MTLADAEGRPSRSELEVGSIFGSYEIIRKLGEGGMGAVYEARRQGLEKRVALKVMTSSDNVAATSRFIQEARIAASLEHPHVVDCFDVGAVDGRPFLALELLEGESLKDRLGRGPLSVSEACDLFLPLCSAMAAAHDRGIVHRDLKPDNIFLSRKLRAVVPKVLDFGIAKAQSVSGAPGMTQTASILGTPHYMSPEQANDSKNVDGRSDQFSLGSILWECLTGRVLFEGATLVEVLMRVVTAPVPPPSSVMPSVPRPLDQVVLRLLSRVPAERFASARSLGAALLPFASEGERTRWSSEFNDVSQLSTLSAGTPTDAAPRAGLAGPDTLQATSRSLPPQGPRARSRGLALAGLAVATLAGVAVWRWSIAASAASAETPRTVVRAAVPRPAPAPLVAPESAPPAAPESAPPAAPVAAPVAAAVLAAPPAAGAPVAAPAEETEAEADTPRGAGGRSHRRPHRPHLRHRNL